MLDETESKKFREIIYSILNPTLSYRSVKKDYDDARNINKEICKKCGGECCKRCGCNFSPDDFEEISFEYLKEQLEKGYISVEFIDGEIIYDDFGVYILRARNQGAPVIDFTYHRTPCILWTESEGCKLDDKDRPSGGRLLIPTEKMGEGLYGKVHLCNSSYTLRQCCYEWKPHQAILRQLIEHFKDKDIPCSL